VAAYSGDDWNQPVTSLAAAEPVVVGKAETGLSTVPNPAAAEVGQALADSAVLSGGFSPTGTITFTLLNPSGTTLHTETVSVDGAGTYSTVGAPVANLPGTWQWLAVYSGDANNLGSASQLGDEPVVVTGEAQPAQPRITTTPDPTSATVGAGLKDSAVLADGDSPTGTITFTLYAPDETVAYTESVAVDGNGSYSTQTPFVAEVAGTWHWQAAYGGDEMNAEAVSVKADEAVTIVKAQPTIVTTPDPGTVTGSATLQDSATLAGGHNPTGSITFTLYDPNNHVAYTETVTVNGNGVYTTHTGLTASAPGTWHWTAAYSGDAGNLPVSSLAADEPVTITATGAVLAETGLTTPIQTVAIAMVLAGLIAIFMAVAWRQRSL